MSEINIKQFGIWMDTHHATVVGKVSENNFVVIEHITNPSAESNSSEKQAHHAERTLQQKFFKEIAAHMENATEVHITGTGTSQEQFMHYLAETPQFKNTVSSESTTNKMSDEKLVEYISEKFN